MEFYLKKVLTDYEKNWIDSVLSGIVNAIYFEIKDYYDNYSIDYSIDYSGMYMNGLLRLIIVESTVMLAILI